MEGQVRWPGCVGGQATEGARGGERQAQEAAGRCDARQRDAEGDRVKKMVTPAVRREAVTQLRVGFEVSERRACAALEVDRSSVRYRSSRPDDAIARARLRELAAVRRRFGYRRLHILMSREGLIMNHKKRFRLLGVGGCRPRECLALVADTSLPGLRVVRELDAIIAVRGRPAMCVSDNGTELTSIAVLRWSQETRIEWHYIAPGKPQQNAFIESFNGRLRMSCSTRRCSRRSPMRGRCSRAFKMTTTRSGHTVGSAISRRPPTPYSTPLGRNGPGRLSYLGAPRPGPLQHRATRAPMTPGLYSSLDERRGSGHLRHHAEQPMSRLSSTRAPAPKVSPRLVATAFFAGALAVPLFHQVLFLLLYLLGVIPVAPFSLEPI